jgi:hypothetical protein
MLQRMLENPIVIRPGSKPGNRLRLRIPQSLSLRDDRGLTRSYAVGVDREAGRRLAAGPALRASTGRVADRACDRQHRGGAARDIEVME